MNVLRAPSEDSPARVGHPAWVGAGADRRSDDQPCRRLRSRGSSPARSLPRRAQSSGGRPERPQGPRRHPRIDSRRHALHDPPPPAPTRKIEPQISFGVWSTRSSTASGRPQTTQGSPSSRPDWTGVSRRARGAGRVPACPSSTRHPAAARRRRRSESGETARGLLLRHCASQSSCTVSGAVDEHAVDVTVANEYEGVRHLARRLRLRPGRERARARRTRSGPAGP